MQNLHAFNHDFESTAGNNEWILIFNIWDLCKTCQAVARLFWYVSFNIHKRAWKLANEQHLLPAQWDGTRQWTNTRPAPPHNETMSKTSSLLMPVNGKGVTTAINLFNREQGSALFRLLPSLHADGTPQGLFTHVFSGPLFPYRPVIADHGLLSNYAKGSDEKKGKEATNG